MRSAWHIADVPLALTNVCFEGNNGHDADVARCLLLTLSGRLGEINIRYSSPMSH